MSWYASAWAARCRVGNPTRKLVLLALAENCNPDGYSPVSYEYLANVSECSEKSVQRHLAALVDMGLLERRRRRDAKGHLLGYQMWLQLDNQDHLRPIAKTSRAATACDATLPDETEAQETKCPVGPADSLSTLPDRESTPSPIYSPMERETAGARAERENDDGTDAAGDTEGTGDTDATGGTEGTGDTGGTDTTGDAPLNAPRIRKILADRGFSWHEVMRASTVRLISQWVRQKISESTLREAIELAERTAYGRPQSPTYYQWAVGRVLEGPTQKGPQTGVAPAGPDQQQDGREPSKGSLHDLYAKDYAAGASSDDDLPEFLR